MGMTGKLKLDGNDLFEEYGVFAIRGSFNDFVKMPDLDEPSSNKWSGEDGEDVYLVNRTVSARDISLTFLMSADTIPALLVNRNALFVALRADGWRVLYIEQFDREYKLYYKTCESAEYIRGSKYRIKMVLKFRMDFSESPTGDFEIDIH